MLMGHMDVVPVVPGTEADWTHAPFSGHVDDTYIWGRGAIDMKDQVAGILEAVEYALAHGWQHERTLLLAFGQDEETTQYGAGAIGRALEERGIELEYLNRRGRLPYYFGCRVWRGRGLAYACRPRGEGLRRYHTQDEE